MNARSLRHLRGSRLHSRQSGLTLLGLAIAVALSALIFAGIAYFVGQVIDGNKTSNAVRDFDAFEANVSQLYEGNALGFANATQASLVSSGVIPAPLINAGTLMTPYGTSITLAPASDGPSGAGNALQITFLVPQSACTPFVKGVEANYGKVVVASTTIKDDLAGTAFDTSNLSTACGSASGTASVELFIVG